MGNGLGVERTNPEQERLLEALKSVSIGCASMRELARLANIAEYRVIGILYRLQELGYIDEIGHVGRDSCRWIWVEY